MDSRTTKLVIGVVVAIALLTSIGLAAFYQHRALELRTDVAEAHAAIEALKHQLLLKQPNAPNVVLDFAGPVRDADEVGARRLDFEDEDPGGDGTNSRIQELEAALQAKERQLAALQDRGTNRPSGPSDGRGDWASRMADFQRRDPEGYQEMVARRDAARNQMRDAFARQAAHLMEEEVVDATDTVQAERQAMLQLVGETWQMAEQLYGDVPPTNRWGVVRTIRQNLETLSPMLDVERNRAFSQLALESGYSAQDTAVFVDYLNQVIEATSTAPLRRAIRHGAHGGGRGGPPPTQPTVPGQPPVSR